MSRRKGANRPVFVDRTGRRRRLFTVLAAGGGVALTLMLGMVVAGFLGVEGAGLPGLPQLLPDRPVAEESPSPAPDASAPDPETVTAPSPLPTKTTGKPGATPTPSPSVRGNRPTERPHPSPTKKK